MQMVEARRWSHAEEQASQRREKNARELHEWEKRITAQENEARRREHEERLKQLSVSQCTGGLMVWGWGYI